jgi:PEP-CTERM motif
MCHAGNIAFNGFETGTGDWSFTASGQTGDANGSITQTASGAGPLALTAFDGSFYGTVHGNTNGYSTGYANGGSSFFGFDTSVPPYPGSPFTQSIAVYINVNTPAPSNAGTPAFWIDDSPSSSSPSDAGSGGIGYGGEHNFRLSYTGTSVAVTADGSTPLATLTTSGWYVFQMIYAKGATSTSLATTTLSILDHNGHQVGTSAFLLDSSDADPLESQYLQGPGYVWLTVWQNNFSNDYLGIDDVRADTVSGVPEPASFALLGGGFVLLAGFGMARRKRAA